MCKPKAPKIDPPPSLPAFEPPPTLDLGGEDASLNRKLVNSNRTGRDSLLAESHARALSAARTGTPRQIGPEGGFPDYGWATRPTIGHSTATVKLGRHGNRPAVQSNDNDMFLQLTAMRDQQDAHLGLPGRTIRSRRRAGSGSMKPSIRIVRPDTSVAPNTTRF